MKLKKFNLIILTLILSSFVLGIYFYPRLPVGLVSLWTAFSIPLVSLFTFLFYLLIPRIDPLKQNIEKFRRQYDLYFLLLFIFSFYVYLLVLFRRLGLEFNLGQLLALPLAILFYYSGLLIEKAKRNWFIGIRTPWTLSNEEVWDKTHKVGSKLFKIASLIILFGFFFPDHLLWFILLPVFLISVYSFIYSYFEYQKVNKKF